MITRCDHCGSKFEVSAELVNSSDPGVRCGECLSLFDARANLFNETEYRKSAATLKPVQKRKPAKVAEIVDPDFLETADTVAVEHIYTSAGVKSREISREQGFTVDHFHSDITNPDTAPLSDHQADYQRTQPRAYGPDSKYPTDIEFERTLATESALPDRDRTDISDRLDDYKKAGKTTYPDSSDPEDNRELSDSELYQLALTDGELPDHELADRDLATSDLVDPDLKGPDSPNRKRQNLRDQEQRALQIEPERDFSELSSVDIALDQSRLDERREEAFARRDIDQQSDFDDRNLARDSGIVGKEDSHYTPDDVLKRPAVLRDNGRRPEEATRFNSDTPEFDISLDDDQHTVISAGPGQSEQTKYELPLGELPGREQLRRERPDSQRTHSHRRVLLAESSTENDTRQPADYKSVAKEHALGERTVNPAVHDRKAIDQSYRSPTSNRPAGHHDEIKDDVASGTDSRSRSAVSDGVPDKRKESVRESSVRKSPIHESSAQEMRRYQRYRPAVDVDHVDDEPLDDQQMDDVVTQTSPRTVTQQRSSAGALFWMVGLVLAIGLLLFAARGLIANMNLPEPVITAFCQLTGCVPDQAKKNVDQLQTMRKRLYPHPEIENAIVISVDVVNNSIYKQPLPTLAVSLLNEDDEPVAERDFASADYEVVDGSEAGYLMPNEPTRIKIEVINTGLAAADVELAFK